MAAIRLPGAMTVPLRRVADGAGRWETWSLAEPLGSLVLAVVTLAAAAIVIASTRTSWRLSDVAIFISLGYGAASLLFRAVPPRRPVSLSLIVAINPMLMALSLPSIVLYRRYPMHSQLVAQARIDAKTGLLNAGTWQHEAEVEFARAQRTASPPAVAMVDIDHFGTAHDTVGHQAGDRVLRGIADSLRDDLRG